MGKIMILFVIFCLCFVAYPARAETEVTKESLYYDYVYFNRERSPYVVKDQLILRPGQTIKIDMGVEFIFEDGAGVCLYNGECLKGDYLYKDGLGGTKVEVSFNSYMTIGESGEEIRYLADYSHEGRESVGISLKSSFDSVFVVKIKDMINTWDQHKILIYVSDVDFDNTLRFNGLPPYQDNYNTEAPDIDPELDQDEERDVSSEAASDPLKGKIFLQVEENGEAWYVYPEDGLRYYLGRPNDAFRIMKELSLGVSHDFVTSHSIFPESVSGKIILDVEDSGKAYYIDPRDKRAYYLGRPDDAFKVMRERGIGISNMDLDRISPGY